MNATGTTKSKPAAYTSCKYTPPFDEMTLAAGSDGLKDLWFTGRRYFGGAVGHNSNSVIVPHHRVVGASGSLTGFGGGIARMLAPLESERVHCSSFFVPKCSTTP